MSLLVATYRNSVSTFPVLGVDLYLQYNFKYSNPGISQKGNWYIFQKQLNPAAPDITWSFFWSFHTSFPIHLSRFFPLYFYLFIYVLLSFVFHFLLLDLYNFISYSSVFCSPFNFCSHCFLPTTFFGCCLLFLALLMFTLHPQLTLLFIPYFRVTILPCFTVSLCGWSFRSRCPGGR